MASNIYAIKCPCCGRSAIEDHYYKTGEQYTFCPRCGYNYSKTIKTYTDKGIEYIEEENNGHGVFILAYKDGSRQNTLIDTPISDEALEEYKESLRQDSVNLEKSYLVLYKDGIFNVLAGHPPDNFYLSFEEYREKMFAKYGIPDYDFMVPIDE